MGFPLCFGCTRAANGRVRGQRSVSIFATALLPSPGFQPLFFIRAREVSAHRFRSGRTSAFQDLVDLRLVQKLRMLRARGFLFVGVVVPFVRVGSTSSTSSFPRPSHVGTSVSWCFDLHFHLFASSVPRFLRRVLRIAFERTSLMPTSSLVATFVPAGRVASRPTASDRLHPPLDPFLAPFAASSTRCTDFHPSFLFHSSTSLFFFAFPSCLRFVFRESVLDRLSRPIRRLLRTQVEVPEGTLPDLLSQAILVAYAKLHRVFLDRCASMARIHPFPCFPPAKLSRS